MRTYSWASPPREATMRTALPSYAPSDSKQRRQQPPCLDRAPAAHATAKILARGAGTSSPWSMQSAATRRASARTAATAASRVAPYAITPGMDSISAHQRPSSSCPSVIGIDSTVVLMDIKRRSERIQWHACHYFRRLRAGGDRVRLGGDWAVVDAGVAQGNLQIAGAGERALAQRFREIGRGQARTQSTHP